MAVDFSGLVLGPNITTFGRDVTVTPVASQPGNPQPYAARGVFDRAHLPEQIYQNQLSSTAPMLGIRLQDFSIPVVRKDEIAIDGVDYVIDDIEPDGQGGATLMLKLK